MKNNSKSIRNCYSNTKTTIIIIKLRKSVTNSKIKSLKIKTIHNRKATPIPIICSFKCLHHRLVIHQSDSVGWAQAY